MLGKTIDVEIDGTKWTVREPSYAEVMDYYNSAESDPAGAGVRMVSACVVSGPALDASAPARIITQLLVEITKLMGVEQMMELAQALNGL